MLWLWPMAAADVAPSIRLDVSEQDSGYRVKVGMPGVRKAAIDECMAEAAPRHVVGRGDAGPASTAAHPVGSAAPSMAIVTP